MSDLKNEPIRLFESIRPKRIGESIPIANRNTLVYGHAQLRCWHDCAVVRLVLADSTNGRAYATVLSPSVCLSVDCNVFIVAKLCVLPKCCLKKQIENGLCRIEWSRDR